MELYNFEYPTIIIRFSNSIILNVPRYFILEHRVHGAQNKVNNIRKLLSKVASTAFPY